MRNVNKGIFFLIYTRHSTLEETCAITVAIAVEEIRESTILDNLTYHFCIPEVRGKFMALCNYIRKVENWN